MKKLELLAPAGDFDKLKTALHFGADAVYIGGTNFGLRAYAGNFDTEQLKDAVEFVHSKGKKVYLTVNIFAHNRDIKALPEYLQYLESIKADAVIVSDIGVFRLVKKLTKLPVHISTQANITNLEAAKFWAEAGAERLVLARELTLKEIGEIRNGLDGKVELEAFVHGAMCISYSGRCLLSNYLSNRDANRGECVQSCRWEYSITEAGRKGYPLTLGEDGRGTYILNSRDLNMIEHIDKMAEAGVTSYKIEGRMKSGYYAAATVGAYRRAIDSYIRDPKNYTADPMLVEELYKSGHRTFTTGFYLGEKDNVNLESSQPRLEYTFVAEILEDGWAEMRNRFKKGDVLEIVSPSGTHNKTITVGEMTDEEGNFIEDVKFVQQKVKIKADIKLEPFDLLRRKNAD